MPQSFFDSQRGQQYNGFNNMLAAFCANCFKEDLMCPIGVRYLTFERSYRYVLER